MAQLYEHGDVHVMSMYLLYFWFCPDNLWRLDLFLKTRYALYYFCNNGTTVNIFAIFQSKYKHCKPHQPSYKQILDVSCYWLLCLKLSRLMTKQTKWHVRPAKTQIRLGIRPVWSESSLSVWRKLGSSLGAQSFCWFFHEAAQMLCVISVQQAE